MNVQRFLLRCRLGGTLIPLANSSAGAPAMGKHEGQPEVSDATRKG